MAGKDGGGEGKGGGDPIGKALEFHGRRAKGKASPPAEPETPLSYADFKPAAWCVHDLYGDPRIRGEDHAGKQHNFDPSDPAAQAITAPAMILILRSCSHRRAEAEDRLHEYTKSPDLQGGVAFLHTLPNGIPHVWSRLENGEAFHVGPALHPSLLPLAAQILLAELERERNRRELAEGSQISISMRLQ